MIKLLNPWYVVGIIDGEGTFFHKKYGNMTNCVMNISNKNIEVLNEIKDFFGCGHVYENISGTYNDVGRLTFKSKKELKIIIQFLDKYPLRILKRAYENWKTKAQSYILNIPPKEKTKPEIIDKIIQLRKIGHPYDFIATMLDISQSTAWKYGHTTKIN